MSESDIDCDDFSLAVGSSSKSDNRDLENEE